MWASEGFNRSATTANSGMLSPYEIFYGSRPPLPVLPFCKPAYHRVPRQGKLDGQARPCYFLHFGYNRGSDCMKIMDVETGRIVHSRNLTWHQPREPLIPLAPTVGSEVPQLTSGTATPDYIHTTPAATTAPATAQVPASDNAALAPTRNPTASIRDRVIWELGHEGDVRMPGRTRSETRAMRESPRSISLISHAALAQGMATREAFDEPSASTNYRPRTMTFRLSPPVTCRLRLPLPRRNHRSTPRYGVTPGHGSSTICCRPTHSAPPSNQ